MISTVMKLALATSMVAGIATIAHAQTFPERDVRIVVPFSAGGGTDQIARIVADGLTKTWNVPVVVENMPGADGGVAHSVIAQLAGDGYSLMVTSPSLLIGAEEQKGNYDAIGAFTSISRLVTAPSTLVVRDGLPITSIEELIVYAQEHPGELSYGSTGLTSIPFLQMELLKKVAEIDVVHIPYQGGNAQLTGILTGEIDVTFVGIANSLPLIQEGKLKALATNSAESVTGLPDVPTLGELGYEGFEEVSNWTGMYGPKGMDPAVVEKIYADVSAVIGDPATRKIIEDRGFQVVLLPPAEFAASLPEQLELYQSIATNGQ